MPGRSSVAIMNLKIFLLLFLLLPFRGKAGDSILHYRVDPRTQHLALYWKDNKGQVYGSLEHLRQSLERQGQRLVFAMNGGMYRTDRSPLGLYIENSRTIRPLNTAKGTGNFYLRPNGVFYLAAGGRAYVCRTEDFRADPRIRYATQSGPMLVIDGKIHPEFRQGSQNRNIRNGVGILPDGRVLFALSKTKINLYDFAFFFKNAGCKNALYLDGFVSRCYLPGKGWTQTDGSFGVIIGMTER